MTSSANNGAFGWRYDRKSSVHDSSTSRQQPAPINPLYGELRWAGEPRQESYVPVGLASDTGSWSNAAFLDPCYSTHGGDAWLDDLRLGVLDLESSFRAPGDNANAAGTSSLVTMEVAAPILEQAVPVVQRMLPASQACLPPAPNWTPAPGLPWQPPSWNHHPVHTARQHSGHGDIINSLGMRPENSRVQFSTSPAVTGHSELRVTPTGHPHSMTTPHSVQSMTYSDPVPASTSAPRIARWGLTSDTTTFHCLWRSGGTRCRALIAGDRKSISSHLRDAHGFMCDGQTVACVWGQCAAWMQRRNIPRHILACHFEIKSTCPACGLALSRADATRKHRVACMGVARTPATAGMEGGEQDDGRLFFSGVEAHRAV